MNRGALILLFVAVSTCAAAQAPLTLDEALSEAHAANARLPLPAYDVAIAREKRSEARADRWLRVAVEGDFIYAPPSGYDPVVTRGACRMAMIHEGHFLQSDFTFFDKDGSKSTGTGISGFDPKTNRFTTVWYDSRQTTMSIRQSDGAFDGENIVLWATPLDTERPGRKTVARAHLEKDGHLLLHRHFLIDDKGNERMMIELRMTRK